MKRAEKQELVDVIEDRFGKAKAAFLIDFKGMDVEQVTRLRKSLRPVKAEMKVVRNTLAKRALAKYPAKAALLSDYFVGTNAVVFAYEDASASAKLLADFSKDVEKMQLKVGIMDDQKLDQNRIKQLASLPSKEVLRAQLLGLFQQPMSKFVRVLAEVPSGFVRTLNAYNETKK